MVIPPSQASLRELLAVLGTYVEYQRELGVLGFPLTAQAALAPAQAIATRAEAPAAGDLLASPALA